ncbi:branched-chain amino acid ABC transporter permease [Phaeobacter sp. HF9A]|uniref:branched-chain amino acid ABC transporter permease n=1 Tax=Phaeobacter sp. HF9A TaxID=2721561 RepID=UPI00142F8650|nr:branched-chain amino acid ABC transporter permease [Phaeobacter sp. HF9A]NIZ12337.1 branched-chain amino acid ABC transporter permease [Phaeobacter sp. HF9A]
MIRISELLVLAAGLMAAILGALFIDSGLLFLLCEVLVIFLLAQMWNLLAGFSGQMSLGHQAFVGLGAYTLFYIANHTAIPLWLVLALVPCLIGLLAIPLGLVMFHLKQAYFAVGMWVVAEILMQLTAKAQWLGGTSGMTLRPGGTMLSGEPERPAFAIAAFGAVALVVALRVFLRTRLGLATLALRENEAAAASAGVDVKRLHLILFCLTAAGTSAAGGLYYITSLYITPQDAFQINWMITMMFVTVIGGLGTLTGPALGTIILIGAREAMTAAGYSGGQYWIVMGAAAVIVLLLAPRGLWPALAPRIRAAFTTSTKSKA